MAKQISITAGGYIKIQDTGTKAIELYSPASNVSYVLYATRYFFFLQAEDERTVGYLWTAFVDYLSAPFASEQDFVDWLDANISQGAGQILIGSYIDSFETDLYIYSGFFIDSAPTIRRWKDGLKYQAQGVTNLTTDWTNRTSLTYVQI